jgi:hypothetical protein
MRARPEGVGENDWDVVYVEGSYDLIETFGGAQSSWTSTNDQDIDVAATLSTLETFFGLTPRLILLHFLPVGLADFPFVSHAACVSQIQSKSTANERRSEGNREEGEKWS